MDGTAACQAHGLQRRDSSTPGTRSPSHLDYSAESFQRFLRSVLLLLSASLGAGALHIAKNASRTLTIPGASCHTLPEPSGAGVAHLGMRRHRAESPLAASDSIAMEIPMAVGSKTIDAKLSAFRLQQRKNPSKGSILKHSSPLSLAPHPGADGGSRRSFRVLQKLERRELVFRYHGFPGGEGWLLYLCLVVPDDVWSSRLVDGTEEAAHGRMFKQLR
ncbi:hypothetical protein AOLI_G00200950 [Acnodon oligacanthus]